MKSAIYMGKKNTEIREVPIPKVGDNDVLIKNICSSICGTDIAVYTKGTGTGHKITVGMEFGHETFSEVYAVGRNITEFKVGQRVYPYPLFAKNDTSSAGTIGGFSEYILVPEARLNHSLYLVPYSISDRSACLIEPFTVGCRAARRSQPQNRENAVVFGFGTIGIAAAISLKHFGADKVMLVSKQRGYRVGIDDYMAKPIDLDKLFLRIGALLRRAKIASSRKLEIGSFVMDADEHTAYLGDKEIAMTSREFSILYKLLSYPKKTFTRAQLMDEF